MSELSRTGTDRMEGRYSNYFEVGHNAYEFLIDFGQSFEDVGAETLHTRIVTSPVYARRLAQILEKALVQYQLTYGSIPTEQEQ